MTLFVIIALKYIKFGGIKSEKSDIELGEFEKFLLSKENALILYMIIPVIFVIFIDG